MQRFFKHFKIPIRKRLFFVTVYIGIYLRQEKIYVNKIKNFSFTYAKTFLYILRGLFHQRITTLPKRLKIHVI